MTAGRDTKVLLVLNPNSSKVSGRESGSVGWEPLSVRSLGLARSQPLRTFGFWALFQVITEALRQNLDPLTPPGTALEYMTGPLDSPESINDAPTSVLSAAATFKALQPIDALPYSGFLICCFSDHPLVGMLRHMVPNIPCIGIFEASILHALICGTKFGILTTGRDAVPGIDAGVRALLGGNSDRYAGTVASGLGVVELQTGERKIVERRIKESAAKVAAKGADVIILGCAGAYAAMRLSSRSLCFLHIPSVRVSCSPFFFPLFPSLRRHVRHGNPRYVLAARFLPLRPARTRSPTIAPTSQPPHLPTSHP